MKRSGTSEHSNIGSVAIAKTFGRFWFQVLRFIVKKLSGKGLEHFSITGRIYRFLVRHLVGEDIISVSVHGQKMYVPTTFGLTLLSAGTYQSEKLMTNLFIEFLTEGMIVVDVGAHVGFYTLLAARAVGNKGKVFCFEPEPSNYALLLKNIKENSYSNVVPVQRAVTDTTGHVELFIARDSSGHSVGSHNQLQKAIIVDSITLDDFLAGREHPVHLIKIDVEGAEMAVLKGMKRIIDNNPGLNIFAEFNPSALRRVGFSPVEYLQMLANLGFEIRVINEQKQSFELAAASQIIRMCKNAEYVNLLCRRAQKSLN